MEQMEKTLWDSFQEYRGRDRPGIPRGELLRLMVKIAEAIDLLNNESQMIHGDIRPQNILLVRDKIQLRESPHTVPMRGMIANLPRGFTPAYSAPEVFDGLLSRFTDQFSLAVVYQEMLTGARPYPGADIHQLIEEHIAGMPNLSSLPPRDQEIVARALRKYPDDRFQSCQDFINALVTTQEK